MIKQRHQWPEGTHCAYCDRPFTQKNVVKTKDHVWPLGRDGWNDIRNYVSCCSTCNGLKGDMHISKFAMWVRVKIKRDHEMYPFISKMSFNAWKIYNKMIPELKRIRKIKYNL